MGTGVPPGLQNRWKAERPSAGSIPVRLRTSVVFELVPYRTSVVNGGFIPSLGVSLWLESIPIDGRLRARRFHTTRPVASRRRQANDNEAQRDTYSVNIERSPASARGHLFYTSLLFVLVAAAVTALMVIAHQTTDSVALTVLVGSTSGVTVMSALQAVDIGREIRAVRAHGAGVNAA